MLNGTARPRQRRRRRWLLDPPPASGQRPAAPRSARCQPAGQPGRRQGPAASRTSRPPGTTRGGRVQPGRTGRHGLRRGQPRPGDAAGLLLSSAASTSPARQPRAPHGHRQHRRRQQIRTRRPVRPAGLDCDSSGTLPGGAPAVCTVFNPADYNVVDDRVVPSPYDTDVLARPVSTTLASTLVAGGNIGDNVALSPLVKAARKGRSRLFRCTASRCHEIVDITQDRTEGLAQEL